MANHPTHHRAEHPGKILSRLLDRAGLNGSRLAKLLGGIPANRITKICAGQCGISADTALRLARAFPEHSADCWMKLQSDYELRKQEEELGDELKTIHPVKLINSGS